MNTFSSNTFSLPNTPLTSLNSKSQSVRPHIATLQKDALTLRFAAKGDEKNNADGDEGKENNDTEKDKNKKNPWRRKPTANVWNHHRSPRTEKRFGLRIKFWGF